jgi:DNA polymerase V
MPDSSVLHLAGSAPGVRLALLGELAEFRRVLALTGWRPSAGFPSPATDYEEGRVDLNQVLMPHGPATYLTRASGNSMIAAGIHDGDYLVVDRSLTPRPGQIVVAAVDGELLVKTFRLSGGRAWLVSEDPPWSLDVTDADMAVWGVVTWSLHSLPG